MLSALLTGVNRAYPYLDPADRRMEGESAGPLAGHMEDLFRTGAEVAEWCGGLFPYHHSGFRLIIPRRSIDPQPQQQSTRAASRRACRR